MGQAASSNDTANENPIHQGPLDLSFDPKEREGLTTDEVENLYKRWGYNELPVIEISLWWVFFLQFTGTMQYMLELAIIIAAAVQAWGVAGICLGMVSCNGFLAFIEELKAAVALAELTNRMECRIPTLRDGRAEQLLTRLLVPGDVIFLMGGAEVPADVDWLEGDILSIDTAALTGEPLPRKYPSEQFGKLILCGSTVKAGEAYCIVRKTGVNTEIGAGQAEAQQIKDKETPPIASRLELRILLFCKIIILTALVDVIVIFLAKGLGVPKSFETAGGVHDDLLTCLSIIVASVPIGLPLIIQVTMALGAARMATEFDCVVTSLPALEDISQMNVMCSDKTGTLTTAKITIHAESVWTCGGFTKEDLALFAGLASSRDKREDAIERSVINHFDKVFGQAKAMTMEKEYKKIRNVGFNPIYKRVIFEFSHPSYGTITIAKGLSTKVLDTADQGVDDASDQWKCEDYQTLMPVVSRIDVDFSKTGYKTLGVVVRIRDGPFRFVGILPMFDPPRHDTAQTIRNLVAAGVEVKMCTGDHMSIAKETARLVGMGVNIHSGSETREGTAGRDELIMEANGFAHVLPKDKREIVLVLRHRHECYVGITGDGVGCAPAMSAAQCGVAVDDATDAAKNAAAVILTSPGLSALYAAVVDSRRILGKIKSYVTYRLASICQLLFVLTLLIFISNCSINALYVVLLGLLNDLTMVPLPYDLQQASANQESPDITKQLKLAAMFCMLETGFSMLFAYGVGPSGLGTRDYTMHKGGPGGVGGCRTQLQAVIWLQIFIASEILIFSARAPSFLWASLRPSVWLVVSVMGGSIIASIIANQATAWGNIPAQDIVLIWCYDLLVLVFIDAVKVAFLRYFNESEDVLPDYEYVKSHHEFYYTISPGPESFDRTSVASNRMNDWAIENSERLSSMDPATRESLASESKQQHTSATTLAKAGPAGAGVSLATGRASLSQAGGAAAAAPQQRPSLITMGPLRPNTPASNPRGVVIRG